MRSNTTVANQYRAAVNGHGAMPPTYRSSSLSVDRWLLEVGWRHLVGVLMIIYCLVPLLYVLSVSLNPGATLTGSNSLFSNVSLENFMALGSGKYAAYWSWVVNSLIVSTTTAIGTVLMGAAAAYAFSRFRFKGRRGTLTGLLLVQMFPQMLAFVALYLLLLGIQDIFPVMGLNSKLGLICVYLGGALGSNTFLLYGFFNSIPRSLDEAAMIDGATHAQTFWTIIMPLVRPVLAVVGLLSFISSLGDFVIAKVVLQDQSQFTLAVGMYMWAADERTAPWGIFAAGAVLAAIPVILLFQYLQKYIVSGLTAGGVKEEARALLLSRPRPRPLSPWDEAGALRSGDGQRAWGAAWRAVCVGCCVPGAGRVYEVGCCVRGCCVGRAAFLGWAAFGCAVWGGQVTCRCGSRHHEHCGHGFPTMSHAIPM